MKVATEQTFVDLTSDYQLRQDALEMLTDDSGVIRGSSDDVERMMFQLFFQQQVEAECQTADCND